MKLKIEEWAIDRVLSYANNARLHSDDQVSAIAKSITEFGFVNPCLVDADGVLIAGHGRVSASKQLGRETVPVIRLGHLSADQARALRLADNALPLQATWSKELVIGEIGDLKLAGYDLGLLGFPEAQLRGWGIALGSEPAVDPEDVPEPPKVPVSRSGDVWLLVNHRLMCGDSTKGADVERLLVGAKPHLMVTDPPYGVEYDPNWRNDADRVNGKPYGARAVGQVQNDDQADWTAAWRLFSGDVVYVWHAGRHASAVQGSLERVGFEMVSQIIWAKTRLIISRGDYHWQHEPCWYAVRKGKKHRWSGDRSQTTLWTIAHPKSETGHGTQKPVECMKRPIENNSKVGDAVYEPFSGSGTAIVAAELTGRECLAMEIDPGYVDVAVLRWEALTKQVAILEATGKSFAETAADRAKKKKAAPATSVARKKGARTKEARAPV